MSQANLTSPSTAKLRRILHVIPDTAVDPDEKYLGSTKDIRGRTEYFAARGIECDELVVPARSDKFLLAQLRERDLDIYQAVLVEIPLYPASLGFLRRNDICRAPA